MQEEDNNMESKEWEIPPFSVVNQDPEESLGVTPQLQALFHQMGYLDRCNWVSLKPETTSRILLGTWCKKLIVKLSLFLIKPLVHQQNEVNLQTASCIRAQLHQVNHLTEQVRELTKEQEKLLSLCEKLKEENRQFREQTGKADRQEESK